MATDSVKINLEVASKAAELALKNIKQTTDQAHNSFEVFKGAFAAGLAVDGVKKAISVVTGIYSSMIGEAGRAEQSVQNMNVALRQAGLYSGQTSQDLQNFADQIERTTIYSGEAAESAVTLLASLTSLDQDGIKSATLAATDLAATLNIDLSTATEMITKAINGNVTAFNKMGIEIKKGSTDAERLQNVLSALSRQQGAAAEASNTYLGAQEKLENQQGKLLETLGKMVTTNPQVVEGINSLASAFAEATEFAEENAENITLLTKSLSASLVIVAAATAAWAAYAITGGSVTVALVGIELAARKAWLAVTGPVGLVVGAVVAVGAAVFLVTKYWDNITIATLNATAAVLDYSAKAAGIFSTSAEKSIKAQAEALRDKAKAIKEARDAEVKAAADAKAAQEQADKDKAAEALRAKQKQELEELRIINGQKLELKRSTNAQLVIAETEMHLTLQQLQVEHEQAMYEASGQYDQLMFEKQLMQQEALLAARQEHERMVLEESITASNAKANLVEDEIAREKAMREAAAKAEIDRIQLSNKQQIELTKQRNRTEETIAKERVANQSSTFSTIATLQNSNNKTLQTIGKAAALAQISIDTPVAIGRALAAFPPPANFIAAAAVGAAMAAQSAQVAGLAFENGGVVPGVSYTGDQLQVRVNSGEMILNRKQQAELFEVANGRGTDNSGLAAQVESLAVSVRSLASQPLVVTVSGRELIRVTRDELASGRTIV